MSVTTKIIEVHLCDYCGAETHSCCMACSKDLCHSCIREKKLEFQHAVSFSGTLDGVFCSECQQNPSVTRSPSFKAYIGVQMLIQELKEFVDGFNERKKKAEALVEKYYREWRGDKE